MTPKELLYIEDALGHAKFLTTQWDDAAAKLTRALEISEEKPELPPLIYAAVSPEGIVR